MKQLCLKDVNSVFNYLIFNQGKSVAAISRATGISCGTVFKILMHFYEAPFGGIFVYYSGYSDNVDLAVANTDMAYDIPKWHIDTSRMDRIPVENITPEERMFLYSILKNSAEEGLRHLGSIIDEGGSGLEAVIWKKFQFNTGQLFGNRYYGVLKKAIAGRVMIQVEYANGEQKWRLALKPLGVAFNPDSGFWYIIAQNEDSDIYPYRIDRIKSASLMETTFTYPEGFELKSYINKALGMESGNMAFVEVLFKNEGNVVSKAVRKLNGRGEIRYIDGGSIVFSGQVEGINSFKSWLRGFGSSVTVIKPEWLKDDIVQSYKKVLDNYRNLEHYKKLIESS